MTQVNSALIKKIRPEMEAALKEVGEKYGLKFTCGNGTYGDKGGYAGSMKVEFEATTTADGKSLEQDSFEKHCGLFGFTKDDYNKQIAFRGKSYLLKGFNLGAPKNRLSIEGVHDGKRYGMSTEMYEEAMLLAQAREKMAQAA